MYNGFDWYGRTLEVREDRYAGLTGPGSYRGGSRGGPRGGLRGGLRGGGFRGGFRGGFGGAAGGRDFSSQDLYADYSGPDSQGGLRLGAYSDTGAYTASGATAPYGAAAGAAAFEPEPSQQIMVRNVSARLFISDEVAYTNVRAKAAVVHRERGLGRALRDYRPGRARRDPVRGHALEGLRCRTIRPRSGGGDRDRYVLSASSIA